jgi:hypothetical protein
MRSGLNVKPKSARFVEVLFGHKKVGPSATVLQSRRFIALAYAPLHSAGLDGDRAYIART